MNTTVETLSRENIDILTLISDTPKAKVYLASVKETTQLVVYKELEGEGKLCLYQKIHDIQKQGNGSCFPEYYGMWEDNGKTMLIEEYISGGTLAEHMNGGRRFSETELTGYMLKLCLALRLLHNAKPSIIHRDLKPENIIVTESGILKLLDFDAAREFSEDLNRDTVILGTKEYASPEQFGFSQTDVRSDIYSFGIVFAELLKCTNASTAYVKKSQKIINKATMFDPDRRYSDTDILYRELCSLKESLIYKKYIFIPIILLCLICLGGLINFAADRSGSDNKAGDITEGSETSANTGMSEPLLSEAQTTAIPKATVIIPTDAIVINEDNFPDAIFRKYITENFDTDYGTEGYLSKEELAKIKKINISEMQIADVTGIEYFENLEILNCNKTAISEIDLSRNIALGNFHCSYTGITELDVSKNINLYNLECCHLAMAQIDVSNNIALVNLYVSDTLLDSLDVSKNTNLIHLDCQLTKITSLDVSNNSKLTVLECDSTEIANLDISNNIFLETLICRDTKINNLDISSNISLRTLDCANTNISNLYVGNNTLLSYLHCGDTYVEKLDVSKCRSLLQLDCYRTKITELDLRNNTSLIALHCAGLEITELDLSNNVNLNDLDCADIKTLTKLDLSNNPGIKRLICYNTKIEGLELNQATNFTETDFSNTPLRTVRYDIGEVGCCYNPENLVDFNIDKATNWSGAVYKNGKLTGFSTKDVNIECTYDLGVRGSVKLILSGIYTGQHTYENGVCSECGDKQ